MSAEATDIFGDFNDLFSDLEKKDTEIPTEENITAEPIKTEPIVEFTSQSTDQVMLSAQTKLKMIEQEMNNILVERDDAIHCLMLAIISGQSMLMLGDPGAAKSMLAYEFCNRIDNGVYFQWMLNKTSDPSEILGPVSIKGMENDHYTRVTTGKLPEAHIAFIDEVNLGFLVA